MNDMTMREKIARNMYHAMIVRNTYIILDTRDVTLSVHAWERQSARLQADWLAATDAGLDALLVPNPGMVDAGLAAIGRNNLRDAYEAMLHAAKDGK